jgi:hypothetical protein
MLSKYGTVAALSLCLSLVPTMASAKVWEMTLNGSSWLYNFNGEKMVRDSRVDSEGGRTPICSIPVIMDEGYYYMMPDSKLFVLKRDLQPGYVEISNAKYESACAGLASPDVAEPD